MKLWLKTTLVLFLPGPTTVLGLTTSSSPVSLQEELGCSPTLEMVFNRPVYFDPLGLAQDDNFARMREAELKHGRVAMWAVVASIWTTASDMATTMHDNEKTFSTTTTTVSKMIIGAQQPPKQPTPDVLEEISSTVISLWSHVLLPGNLPSVVGLIKHHVTLTYLVQIVVVCGILETLVLVQIDPQDMPGDYGIGYWGSRDKGNHERQLFVELEHGRLAMLTMLFYLLHDGYVLFY